MNYCKMETKYICSAYDSFDRQKDCLSFKKDILSDSCNNKLSNNICIDLNAILESRKFWLEKLQR